MQTCTHRETYSVYTFRIHTHTYTHIQVHSHAQHIHILHIRHIHISHTHTRTHTHLHTHTHTHPHAHPPTHPISIHNQQAHKRKLTGSQLRVKNNAGKDVGHGVQVEACDIIGSHLPATHVWLKKFQQIASDLGFGSVWTERKKKMVRMQSFVVGCLTL